MQRPEETFFVQEPHPLLRRGQRMYVEEKERTPDGRITQKRFAQLSEAGSETVAIGCPFFITMLEDAMKSRSLEEKMQFRDLAEMIADSTGATIK